MRCFTVLGPSQTGKTTLVEKLAGLEGASRKAVSPYGLNITEFEFGGEPWCALDAPGGTEALGHAQHALIASDACVLCVSPAPDEAVLAAPYLKVIEASGTPCILFINRMDEPRARLRDVIAATLGSAPFLYRAERGVGTGSVRRLSSHEMASRLSYFFWGTMPDQELSAAADRGCGAGATVGDGSSRPVPGT